MSAGGYISGIGHAGLLIWLVMGWGLDSEPLEFDVAPVSVVSGEEYAALVAATSPQPQTEVPPAEAAARAGGDVRPAGAAEPQAAARR
ncbi:hypothetical protein NHG85_17310, partial [Limimaricola sp. ASW11-118]|nr:hypothetical protein [Limimaricola litoreus]